MHCSDHTPVETFDVSADERRDIFYALYVRLSWSCHHTAMGRRLFRDGKMLTLFLDDRPLHIFHLKWRELWILIHWDSFNVIHLNILKSNTYRHQSDRLRSNASVGCFHDHDNAADPLWKVVIAPFRLCLFLKQN